MLFHKLPGLFVVFFCLPDESRAEAGLRVVHKTAGHVVVVVGMGRIPAHDAQAVFQIDAGFFVVADQKQDVTDIFIQDGGRRGLSCLLRDVPRCQKEMIGNIVQSLVVGVDADKIVHMHKFGPVLAAEQVLRGEPCVF